MSMPDDLKQQLAKRRDRKRAAAIAAERARSDELIAESTKRQRARVARMRVRYFRRHYGTAWRDVMRERSK